MQLYTIWADQQVKGDTLLVNFTTVAKKKFQKPMARYIAQTSVRMRFTTA